MGAVTTSADCSLVAVLCRTNFTHNAASVPGSTDFVHTAPGPQFGWEDGGDAAYMTERQISNMWLYEWTDGVVTTTPSSYTMINAAIGGWNYGHWELSLNANASVYMFELKTSLGGHEGSTNSAMYLVLSHRCCRHDVTLPPCLAPRPCPSSCPAPRPCS